jgi:hypothetical protein
MIGGARRRRSGGGSRGGCARRPVGTHPHLFVVGVGNPIAVLCLVRLGAKRVETRRLRSADEQVSGSLSTEGFPKYYMYTNIMISRSASPIFLVKA